MKTIEDDNCDIVRISRVTFKPLFIYLSIFFADMYPCSAINCNGSFPNRPDLINHWAHLHHDKVLMHYSMEKINEVNNMIMKFIRHILRQNLFAHWNDRVHEPQCQ